MNDMLSKTGLDTSMNDAHDHRPDRKSMHRLLLHLLALVPILAVATLLRFNDLNWDQGQHFHPDERHVSNVLSGVHLPDNVDQYFDSGKSPLNPYNIPQSWVYGTLPLFLDRFLAEFLDQGCAQSPALIPRLFGQSILSVTGGPNLQTANCLPGFFTSYDLLTIASRFVSALADLITVAVVYLMGRRLFGWHVGLLAIAFSALCVLQIQHAHFGVVESMVTMCVTWCLYFCARIVTLQPSASRWRGNVTLWSNTALAGLFSGLAVACKISVWPTAVLILVSIVITLMRGRRAPPIAIRSAWGAVLIAGLCAFIGLRVTQPYGFVGASEIEWQYTLHDCDNLADEKQQAICLQTPPLPESVTNSITKLPLFLRTIVVPSARWVAELRSAAAQSSGAEDPPWGWQWANRTPIVFSLVNVVFYGLGLPLGVSAILGTFHASWQWMRGRRWWLYAVPALWTFGFFVYQSTQFVKSIRYLLPIYPVLCILAAVFLVALWQNGRRAIAQRKTRAIGHVRPVIECAAMPVVLLGSVLWALSFIHIYDGEMARVESSRWIYDNVPTAVTMTWRDGGYARQVQLPIRDVQLNANGDAQGGYLFRLNSKTDGVAGPVSGVVIRLNRVQGSGEIETRILEYASGNMLQSVRRTVDEDDAVFTFDQATLLPDTDYVIEFTLVQGQALNAHTSVIANQHYDESGPVHIDGKDGFGTYYYGLSSTSDGTMQVYNEDIPDKLAMLLQGLDEADYLVLYSNRHYASVARLPCRFPLTNAYFTALMEGRLGFELAADFYRFPQLGPFVFNDQEMPQHLMRSANTQGTSPGIEVPYPAAEEAFSVYDHPRVLIFRKTPQYTRARAEQILGIYDLSQVVRQTAFEATNTPVCVK